LQCAGPQGVEIRGAGAEHGDAQLPGKAVEQLTDRRLAFGGGWYVVAAAGDKIDKG